ncbi:MAG TPA: hypothetical protein VL382_11790, partial [Terriglobales bacterium]|nr:hypothetical protein [Terriglobales bacterium]
SLPPEGEVACDLKEVALEETVKRWPILAVAADPHRNLIWLTTSAMPGFAGIAKEDEGKAALLAVNERGRVQRSVELATGEPAVLGDMALAADGTVYVTDSLGGGVYELRGKGRDTATWLRTAKLEKIADGLFSPQTPVLAADRKRLFVADYTIGIAVVELASGKVEYLPHPENIAVTGIDGLYLVGNSLIAIQNGTQPERVLKLALDGAQRAITSAEVLEQATERLGEATHGVARGRGFYVSANVGWDKVDDSGQLKDGQKFTAPVLLRFSLEPRK